MSRASGRGAFRTYQGDGGHTGAVGGSRGDDPGAERWVSTLDSPSLQRDVALAGGRVFLTTDDARLNSLAQTDGTLQWSVEGDALFLSSPAVSDEVVVCSSLANDETASQLRAYGTSDGSERWQTDVPSGTARQPTLHDGTVYVGGQFETDTVAAVTASAGELVWETTLDDAVGPVAAAVDGAFVRTDAALCALDPGDGSVRWRRAVEGESEAYPTVADGTVYAQRGPASFGAWDAGTGEPRWSVEADEETTFSACVADGTVYLSSAQTGLTALRATDGTVQWRRTVGSLVAGEPVYGTLGEPVVTEDTVYLGLDSGLGAVDCADGTAVWQHSFRASRGTDVLYSGQPGVPAVGADTVFAATLAGDVFAAAR